MRHPIRIPFTDLALENRGITAEIHAAVDRILASGSFLLGPELTAFEQEFADYHGAAFAVGVASGLAALKLMLLACGIGPGDEVIVPANTCIATWLAVDQAGATPIPAEPDFQTRNLDIDSLHNAVTSRTRAILAVHLYGLPCDMVRLRDFCSRHNLLLLIDAAQSCGAEWQDRRDLCLGDAAAFSFYPTKNLGTLGDGGAVVTSSAEITEKVQLLRNYGMRDRYHHLLKGDNARLEEFHAAVLRVKLRLLDAGNARRRELAEIYSSILRQSDRVGLQLVPTEATPIWHLYTITTPKRDQVQAFLHGRGIETLIHYPVPPHLTLAYRPLTTNQPALPITEALASAILSLPLYPSMDSAAVHQVAETLLEAVSCPGPP